MSDVLAIASVVIGTCVGAAAFAVLSAVFSEERHVSRRLRTMSDGEVVHAASVEPLTAPFSQRVLGNSAHALTTAVSTLTTKKYIEKMEEKLRLAGPRLRLSAEQFLLLKAVTLLGGLVLGLAAARSLGGSALVRIALIIGATIVGFLVPDAWLSGRVQDRQKAIRRALPDMMDMLMISVEAGLGFDAALGKVVSATEGPLSEEFAVMLQEVQAGIPRRDALTHLAARTGVPELTSFIMAIVQADVFGVSIANVLRSQSREMRVRRRQRAEELAQKAPAEMVFPIILCILPATLIVVAGPAVISIMRAFGAGF